MSNNGNKNACKKIKKCTRCKNRLPRMFFWNGVFWNYRDNICYYCLLNIDKYNPRKKKIVQKSKPIDYMEETKKITGFSEKKISTLLKSWYCHSEIRAAKNVNWEIKISNLIYI